MLHTLENRFMQFSLDTDRASWSLCPRDAGLFLEGVRMEVSYRCGRSRLRALERWDLENVSGPEREDSLHGPLRQLCLSTVPDGHGVRFVLDFAMPQERPLFLWRIAVHNNGQHPVYIDRLTLLDLGSYHRFRFTPHSLPFISPVFYSNGWQSWSYAGAYHPGDRFRRTRLGPLRTPTDVNAGTPHPWRRGRFGSDMFGILGNLKNRRAILAGFLSQIQHFGSLEACLDKPEPRLRMWANGDGARLDPGSSITTDWACLHYLDVDAPDPLGSYLEAVAREAATSYQRSKTPVGWCSWYQFSTEDYVGEVTAGDIQHNLEAIAGLGPDLPLEVVQIDDGFEAQIGDWLSFHPDFPHGVAPLGAEIRRAGFTPGLWLAPFIVHPGSRLAEEHPDWLLRGRRGRFANAGFLWKVFPTALDLTHPEALEYAAEVVRTAVHEWGFPYLKLDFLYAAALPGCYRDPTRTRAQVLRLGLEALREAAGEQAFLLGCGCPLGPAIGLVDAMRIGADTARRWNPSFSGLEVFFSGEMNVPAARNAVHNTLTRAPLHRRWWVNDPDCLLLRPDTHLTLDEVRTLATAITLTGGSLLLSDHLPALPPERLRIARAMLPLIGERPWVLDWLDEPTPRRLRLDLEGAAGPWHLLALFNWADEPRKTSLRLADYHLEAGVYWAREFWRDEVYRLSGGELALGKIPAHGAILLALRQDTPGQPQYLGSDLHLSQGMELVDWCWDPGAGALSFRLERPGRARGHIDLVLPGPPQRTALDGESLTWEDRGQDCYRFLVEFKRSADLRVNCS